MAITITRELERLERWMIFLATVGSTAPFIGLFGTVWGIMHSFSAIAAMHNTNLSVVAPGIAEALFATAIGLVAAIPAVIAYNKINNDLSRFAARMEAFGTEFGAILSRQSEEKGLSHGDASSGGGRRRPRRTPPLPADVGDQRHAAGRRHAGAADHLHGDRTADDQRRQRRPAEDQRGSRSMPIPSRSPSPSRRDGSLYHGRRRGDHRRAGGQACRRRRRTTRRTASSSVATSTSITGG